MTIFGPLPPGVAETVLLLAVLFTAFLIVRAVRRRRDYAPAAPDEDVELPSLTTEGRVTGTVRRIYRDPAQGVWLTEIALGKRRFTVCTTDYAAQTERYANLTGKQADFALYGMATLAPGGVEAMRDQIKDFDKVAVTPELVRLIPVGQYANDYAVIGRILSHRDEEMDTLPLRVYRAQTVRSDELTLVLELAVQREDASAFPDQSMAHGSARLYGYLA